MDMNKQAVISPRESAKRITNLNAAMMGKLESERTVIQKYSDEWAFAHHASMSIYKGKIYAMWSSGRIHEDDCGQRVMWSYTDGLSEWKPAMIFSDTEMGVSSQLVKFAQGFCATEERLYAYYAVAEYKPELLEGENLRPIKNAVYAFSEPWISMKRYCCHLMDDGITWSEPVEVPNGGGNHSAERLPDGRYMTAMGTGVLYTDEINADSVPVWQTSNLPEELVKRIRSEGAPELCEGSFYKTDDGVLHLMMRSGSYLLWHSESYDNGATFKEVYPTRFTDDFAKFQFGRLPDGRYYYVGNSVPDSRRLPLMLAISEDGYNFDKEYIIRDELMQLRKPGAGKGGHYGYPECVIHNGYMYIIYTTMKEEVEITKFSLGQLK